MSLSDIHVYCLLFMPCRFRVLSGSLGAASADFKDIPAAAGRARCLLKRKMMFLGCFMLKLPFTVRLLIMKIPFWILMVKKNLIMMKLTVDLHCDVFFHFPCHS